MIYWKKENGVIDAVVNASLKMNTTLFVTYCQDVTNDYDKYK